MTEQKKDDTRLHLNPLLPLLRSTLVHGGEGATYKQDLLSCSGSHSLRLPALPSLPSSPSSLSPSSPPSSTSFSLPSSPLRKKDESTIEGRRRQYTLLSSASTTSAPSVLFASSPATSPPPTPGSSGQAVRAPALSLRLLGGLSPLPSPRVRRASDDRNDTTKNESDSDGRSQRAKAKEVRIVEGVSEPGASASGAEETAAAGNDQDGEERKVRVRRGSFSRTQQALRQSFRHKLRPPKPLGSEGSGETATLSSSVAVTPVFADPIHSFHVSDKQLLHLELDGGVLYVLSQDRIHLYDTESREHMYSIDAVARRIAVFDHMLYYANRTTVSSNERDVIVAWSTKLRKVTHIFKGHQKWITSLFVHDKMLYSAATDHTCRCWNVVRWTTQGFTTARSQRSARQGPANREETVEEALKLWGELFQSSEAAEPVKAKSSSGIVMPTELRVYRDDDAVTSVAICTERKLLFTASPTQAVRAWSLLSGERVGEYVGHTDWVYGVIVHGGELYSCSRDQTIRSWNIETFECTQVFETATNNLNTKKFFVAGGVLFVICDDFALRLYNTRTGKVIRVLEGHTRPIRCMVLFKSQRELFTASGDGTIRRWNFKKGLELAVYKCHTEGVTSITIDEQRRLLYSAGQDGVVCVWDLSEAGDRANKQLSEMDGELMQYKRRIDNIIQRNAGALDADDKLIKVTDEVLRLIQQGDDYPDAVAKENEAPTTSPVVSPSPSGLPLSPRLASAASAHAASDSQAKAAKSSSNANAAKGTLLKSGLLKLARGDSWRTKPGSSSRTRDEVKHHRDDDYGVRKLHTADAIMEKAQKTRTKGDGAERVVLVDPLEDKRKKKEKEKEKKISNEEPGKATSTGGMKMKDQLFRIGATFSFDRKRREKKEAQQQQQLEVKRSISEGNMPAVPTAHKDRIQWLPEDKYSSNQSLIIKPAGQLEARNARNVDAGGAGSGEMTATAEKKEHSREFDILGWMEEQIAIQDESEEQREERAKSNSDERMNQPQADEQKNLTAEAEQDTDSCQEPGEGPSGPAVVEGIENIALVVMQPFADISYVEFGTVLFKVISLCMRLCDADRRPTTKRELEPEASAVGDEDDDEAKRVRNDLRLSVKEFTRNGMTLLQHIKRKALAKEALAVGPAGLEEDADDVESREDEGADRKAFLAAARIMLAAVKQLAAWLHGLGDSKPGRASERTKSESGSYDAPPADEQQTKTLFANLERQCGPETQHLLAEVRKPLGESAPTSSAAARDTLALGLPVFTELVGTLKRVTDGDAVQSTQWAALADRHLLVLIQAARAVACADNGGSADTEAVQRRRQRLLVLECAVVVKASEAFRCRDDPMTEAAQALLRQKWGQLLAAVVQLLTTIRHECPAPKRNVD